MKRKFRKADLARAKETALAVMYRVWFVLYAESRNLLPVGDPKYLKVGHNSRASICAVGANNYEIGVPEFEFSKLGWGIRVFETRRNL